MIQERLAALRAEMKARNIDAYVIPTSDFHASEYVGEHFKARKYITGFTGSSGTAVITADHAGLWTDGRYFIQAEQQLKGTTVDLYKMGEEGVPTVLEFLKNTLKDGDVLGYDGRVINAAMGEVFSSMMNSKHGSICSDEDLVGLIWEDRPPLPAEPIMIFPEALTGKCTLQKLADVRAVMAEKGADVHLLSSLYDIAWLLNIRGGDISYVPVVLSYLSLTKDSCVWFVQDSALSEEIRAYLDANGIETRPYDSFYEYVCTIPADSTVLMDRSVVNDRICRSIPASVKIIDDINPTELMKAVKNPVEMENIRRSHLKDAVAMCRFMYWLKTNVGKIPMSEITAADHLAELRAQQEGFLDLSFDTICAYADHGAIVHYSATEETSYALKPEGLLLVDSGGHYLEGTTDITRTFALGPVTQAMREDFTRVMQANMRLSHAHFLYGCTGMNLDILARGPMWDADLDFKHGTGHGVGYVLNVHEGPNEFRWKPRKNSDEHGTIEEGMVTTDEPGIYIENAYGIRTENELLCLRGTKNSFGQFMYFEDLTLVPFDRDAIDVSMLSRQERQWLNDYHARVYTAVSPYLPEEERVWLREYTLEL